MPGSTIRSRLISLWPWAAASLAVHGLLLFVLFGNASALHDVSGERLVTVEMLPAPKPEPVTKPETASVPVIAMRSTDAPPLQAGQQAHVALRHAQPTVATPVHQDAALVDPDAADASTRVASFADTAADAKAASPADGRQAMAVREHLERFKYYPASARRHGIVGDVEVGFRLRADGTAENVLVLAGSGYAILDRAAVETVNRAQPFPATGGSYQFRLRFQRL